MKLTNAIAAAVLLALAGAAAANGSLRETEFSTSLTEATGIVRIIVAAFGGAIGLLGIVVAFKGVGGTADVSGSVSRNAKLSMKRVSQGVVITLIGAAILVSALYFLPDKRSERVLSGKEVSVERGPDRTREVMKK
jgi:hypothetical protein